VIFLKRFLDGLVDENHPFRKGPDLKDGSALSTIKPAEVTDGKDAALREQQTRFYFSRVNKN